MRPPAQAWSPRTGRMPNRSPCSTPRPPLTPSPRTGSVSPTPNRPAATSGPRRKAPIRSTPSGPRTASPRRACGPNAKPWTHTAGSSCTATCPSAPRRRLPCWRSPVPDPSTTRLALYKSKSDGSELVSYTTDIGQNLDKLDAAAGFQVVTSSTRPSSPYSGKPIAQSDTSYSTYFSNGTAPASASWVEIPNSSSTFGSNLKLASSAQLVIGVDTNLYRSAANILKTDDSLVIGGDLK